MMPRLSLAKNFSGEIRRDFYAIMRADKSSEEKLSLIFKHTKYALSDTERACSLEILDGLNSKTYNVYTIALNLAECPVLKAFAEAINAGFDFKDNILCAGQPSTQ